MKKDNKKLIIKNELTEFLLYTSPSGDIKVDVLLRNENIWLTQEKIAQLFGVQRPAITKHLKNIFESRELDEEVVCSILEQTTKHGAIKGKMQNVKTKFYNLDAILSVGYRVNSQRAIEFRKWSNTLRRDSAAAEIFLKSKNWLKKQLPRISRQLPVTERDIELRKTDYLNLILIRWLKNLNLKNNYEKG